MFILLCSLCYTISALSSNTGKAILNEFRYPITFTFVQFGFVAFYCLLLISPVLRFSKLRAPTKVILRDTLPIGIFPRWSPFSTVHTMKALSPLFTVAAYALLFGVSYSAKTYISLLPLTFGVMLACSSDFSLSNAVGLLCAFGSAVVFVSSNIFFNKIMPTNHGGGLSQPCQKLDKINLLLYSSSMAFILMVPIWLYYDLQSFHLHPTVSSVIKRVAVICIAIIWFNQSVHPIQAFGICLTFAGLYMYNNAKSDVEKMEAARDLKLPTTNADARMMAGTDSPPESYANTAMTSATGLGSASIVHGRPRAASAVLHLNAHNLSVKITSPFFNTKMSPKDRIASATDSYPSPPPSLDSPPSSTVPLSGAQVGLSIPALLGGGVIYSSQEIEDLVAGHMDKTGEAPPTHEHVALVLAGRRENTS
ncbi:TPT-domain-containing protein [Lentinula edodes]|nr:TPT-domain-containing protein [Lentinula edodes]